MKERLRALGQAHVCFGLSPYQHWEFRKKNSPTHHHGRDSEVLLCFFCPVLRVSWEGPSCRRRRVVRRPPGECSGLSDTNSLGGKAAPCALPSGTMPLGGMAHIDRLNKNYPRGVGSMAQPQKLQVQQQVSSRPMRRSTWYPTRTISLPRGNSGWPSVRANTKSLGRAPQQIWKTFSEPSVPPRLFVFAVQGCVSLVPA